MTKIMNKIFLVLKDIMLPIIMFATIYIIIFMFKRLEKDIFGSSFMEFLGVIFPFILLIVLSLTNIFFDQTNVKNSFFYNFTSFLVVLTITYFCYRALFDQNMFLWHKYTYNINFNYFSDQIAPTKVMLYVLSFANVVLMIEGKLRNEIKASLAQEKNKKRRKNQAIYE